MATQIQFRKGIGNICESWHFPAPSYVRLVQYGERRIYIPEEPWIHKAGEVIYLCLRWSLG